MSTFFVGRLHELAALRALLGEAAGGSGHLALLSGEPGIGKSRLAEEVARDAEARGFVTAWGRSWEGAGTPAFWPWTQVLRRLAASPDLRTALADDALRPLLAPDAAAADAPDAEQARFQLFDAVTRALTRAAAVRPLLVVLDDLHAADTATLTLLHFVARGLHGAAIVVLGTSREAFFASGEAPTLLARISREARPFALARLAAADLDTWVSEAAPALEPARVFAASEGNPLFVEEILAAERKRPGAAWTGAQLPLGIREAVRAHLVLLPEAAQLLLETASVLGREPTRRALEAIARPVEMAALGEALASGVILDVGEGRLRFSHALVQEELYARLSADRRRALHREAALASTSRAEAAHHALSAATPADAKETLGFVELAMREASGRLAHEDAARLGQRALVSLGDHLPPADVCALEVAIAEALVTAGELVEAQRVGERAAEKADRLGLAELGARAVLACTAEIGFSVDPKIVASLRKALASLPDADSSLKAVVMARLSVTVHNSPHEAPEMRRLRDEAIAMARRVGDEKTLLGALYGASSSFPEELQPRERFALFAETVALAERLGTVGRLAPLLPWWVGSFFDVADPAGAARAADRMEALLAPFPQPTYRWRSPLLRAVLAAIAGRFAEADRRSSESLAISREHGVSEGLMMYGIFRTTLPYVRGDDGGLAEALPAIQAAMGSAPMWEVFTALVDAPLGRVDRVRRSFELLRTFPLAQVTGSGQLGWACVRAGLREDAALFRELLSLKATPTPLAWGPGGFGCNGPTSLLRGQLAAMVGEDQEARSRFEEAAAFARAIQSPPFVAQAEIGLAELSAESDRAGARAHAEVALETAEPIGLAAIADRARAVLGKSGRVASTAKARSLRLTREGEMWAVDAGGRRLLLRDSKGLAYLERLVGQPHRAIHVLELAGIDAEGDGGPVLDETAKRAYRARADDLRAELDEATANDDLGRIERARAELDALGTELARALGLGGRDRKVGSVAERARINVQRRLKDVLRRVAEQDAALGRHLELSVKTGLLCMYSPTWPAD